MKSFALAISLAAFTALSGCENEPDQQSAQPAPAPADVSAPAPNPEDPTAKMARAVGTGKPGAAVDIKYEFAAKPEVGTPTEVQVALIPNPGVDSVEATIRGMEGFTLAGPLTAKFDNVEPGKPYTHTFSLLPERTGVFYVTVVASSAIGGSSLSRTFSIPFVVGDVRTEQRKAEPARDASGEAIQPMKAEERRN